MSATIIPLKIYFPKRGFQIGVAAKSLQHLRDTLQAKMGLSNTFKLTLDDGTIVCDPEYFKLLERQTKLNVIEGSPLSKTTTNAAEATVDAARKRMSPSTTTAASKRARLSPESRNKADLNTNQNNSQLLSRICISSVAGNVPMSESPEPASERSRLSTAVQQQKQLQSIVPQPRVLSIPPQSVQNIRSPPVQPAQQLQNSRLSLQQLQRKPMGKTAAQRPGSVIVFPQIQQSIPSPLIHRANLQQRPQGPPFPQQILVPSNQPHAFPGHPPTPLTAPPIMTPPTIQWIPHGAARYPPQSISPYRNTIRPLSPNCPPGGVLYSHQVQVPRPDIPMYQPRPPQPPRQLTQEHIYQMQVEQQMKTTIRMTPSPNPSQMPLPQPVQPQIRPTTPAPQTQPMAVIQSPVGPKCPVVQQAPPPTAMPDNVHIVQQVVELLQAPEPTMIPSTPPALLKVICSKPSTDSRHNMSTPDLSNSTDISDLSNASDFSSPTHVCHLEPADLRGRQVTSVDTDSEDEHTLQIVVGESDNLPPSTPTPPPPPCSLSSPQSQASSSPSRSPTVAAAQKPRKPTELNLLSTQIDDGYCSATTSSLGSADDVKRALPFASFDDYIPLHSCYTESKEDKQENDAIVSIVPQDKCTVSNPKDDSTDEREQQDMLTATASEDFENEPLIIEIPIKVIDGQIYYSHNSTKVKEEPDVARQEVIFIDSEVDDQDSDVNPLEQFINQGTPNSFHLSLDEEEVSEVDTDVEMDRSVESKGDIDEERVVVADHGGEVPVVTTPLDCTLTFDLDKCVADIINVVNSKDKQTANSPCNLKTQTQTTVQVPTAASAPPNACNTASPGTTCHFDGEAIVEESVLIDSSNLHEEGLLSDELIMGNEVVVSLEGSSQALDYLDSSELISNLLLHSCLPQNGRRVSLS